MNRIEHLSHYFYLNISTTPHMKFLCRYIFNLLTKAIRNCKCNFKVILE